MKSMLFAVIVILGACGDEAASMRDSKASPIITVPKSPDGFVKYLTDNAKIECGINSGCSSDTVAIYNLVGIPATEDSRYDFSVCTGVMIRPDLLMTNLHCILDKTGTVKTKCSSDIAIQDANQNITTCSKIISNATDLRNFSADLPFSTRDLALIQLKSSPNLEFGVLSHSGFKNNETYTVDTIEFDQNIKVAAKIVRKNCRHTDINQSIPFISGNDNTFSSLSGCSLHSGNSGSGLKDANGKYIGLVFAKLDQDIISEIWRHKLADNNMTMHHAAFDDYRAAVALSFECMGSHPENGVQWQENGRCLQRVDSNLAEQNVLGTLDSIHQKFSKELGLSDDLARTFKYKLINDGQKVMFAPTCINSDAYSKYFAEKNFSDFALKVWQVDFTVSFHSATSEFTLMNFSSMFLDMDTRMKSNTLNDEFGDQSAELTLQDCSE
jgi:hypothetical protein